MFSFCWQGFKIKVIYQILALFLLAAFAYYRANCINNAAIIQCVCWYGCQCVCVCVCVCVHVYVVYEDTNLYNDIGMT